MNILRARQLTKVYVTKALLGKKETIAVRDLNFSLGYGEVLGIIGPNGAGKTSTLKMLTGCSLPSSGKAELFARDVVKESLGLRYYIGFVPEDNYLPLYLKISQFLEFSGALFSLQPKATWKNLKPVLSLLNLEDKLSRKIDTLSMGQRRAVIIAQAFVNNPKLIFMDEPTAYLDPLLIESFKNLVNGLKKEGRSVVISSHVLGQIKETCDSVLIINQGKRCAYGKINEICKDGNLQDLFIKTIKECK